MFHRTKSPGDSLKKIWTSKNQKQHKQLTTKLQKVSKQAALRNEPIERFLSPIELEHLKKWGDDTNLASTSKLRRQQTIAALRYQLYHHNALEDDDETQSIPSEAEISDPKFEQMIRTMNEEICCSICVFFVNIFSQS